MLPWSSSARFSGSLSYPTTVDRCLRVLLVLLGTVISFVISGSAAGSVPLNRTVVSITFDDGRASQWAAAEALGARGIRATFYVNSPALETPGYLTWEQIGLLAAQGNEIGGHTLTHRDLRALTGDEAHSEICDDRDAIISHGFAATSFAYPFGYSNDALETIVGECGYSSARITVGIAGSAGWCTPAICPYAEAIPAWIPTTIRATGSVTTSTTLEQLKAFVVQAEENGGGWIPFVFHDVGGEDEYSISEERFEAFLDWLVSRRPQGTVIATVGEVTGGAFDPPPVVNVLENSSFEQKSDPDPGSLPDCWEATQFGDNAGTWSQIDSDEAPAGSKVARGTLTSWANGARQLLSKRSDECARAIEPGLRYRITGWYRGTLAPFLAVYWDDGSGSWSTNAVSPDLPASASWRRAQWTAPPAPAGAARLAVGLVVGGAVGTIEVDNLEAGDSFGTPPIVEISSPRESTFVSGGEYLLSADASDDGSVESVEFFVDGVGLGATDARPHELLWDSASVSDGAHELSVLAEDADGGLSSESLRFTVDNTPPSGTLTAPAQGSYLQGDVVLAAASADAGSGVETVEFQRSPVGRDQWTSIHSSVWDTRGTADGGYDLRIRVTDRAGNVSTSATVAAVVDNTPPAVFLLSPVAGSLQRRVVTLVADPREDTSGLKSVAFEIASPGGAGWQLVDILERAPWQTSLSFPQGSRGTVRARAIASDRAGHSFTSSERRFRVDNVAPIAALVCNRGSCGRAFTDAVRISIRARDKGSRVNSIRYTTNGRMPTHSSKRYRGSFVLRATTVVRWRVWDEAGNASRVQSKIVRVR